MSGSSASFEGALHHLMLAGAGAGKTTFLVNKALNSSGYTLITTYTLRNAEEIRNKIRTLNHGVIPPTIDVFPWDTFLLQHGAKPYRRSINSPRITGMQFVNSKAEGAPQWMNSRKIGYYMNSSGQIYSDKLANFVCKCDDNTDGAVIERLTSCYSRIYIDEVQDLAGYDLEFLKKLLHQNKSGIIMTGDPRQAIFTTHWEAKNKQFNNGRTDAYIKSQCSDTCCDIDMVTLNRSFRCSPEICAFSSKLYPKLPEVESCTNYAPTGHEGIFFVRPEDVDDYLSEYEPIQLRESMRTKVSDNYPVLNMGESKGTTYDRVLIYPTNDMLKWICNNSVDLKPGTRAKFYVALTRARYSVGIVCKDKRTYNVGIDGIKKYR